MRPWTNQWPTTRTRNTTRKGRRTRNDLETTVTSSAMPITLSEMMACASLDTVWEKASSRTILGSTEPSSRIIQAATRMCRDDRSVFARASSWSRCIRSNPMRHRSFEQPVGLGARGRSPAHPTTALTSPCIGPPRSVQRLVHNLRALRSRRAAALGRVSALLYAQQGLDDSVRDMGAGYPLLQDTPTTRFRHGKKAVCERRGRAVQGERSLSIGLRTPRPPRFSTWV